jgi:hypothetical protein
MKKTKFILSVSLVVLIFLAACQKDEKPSVALTAKATEAIAATQTSSDGGPIFTTEPSSNDVPLRFVWNEAWIYISRIEFSGELIKPSVGLIKGDPNIHIEWQGYQRVDLLGEPKVFATLEIPDGNYQNIELSMTSSRLNDMLNPNFYFSGSYDPENYGLPFAVSVNQGFTIVMKIESGTINAQSGNFLDGQIEVSLDNLFNGITAEELNNAELTGGVILISSKHNQDLYVKILSNLQVKGLNGNIGSLAWNFHIKPN